MAVRLGVLQQKSNMGMGSISTSDGLRALQRMMAADMPQILFAPMDWKKYFAISNAGSQMDPNRQLLSELRAARPQKAGDLKRAAEKESFLAAATGSSGGIAEATSINGSDCVAGQSHPGDQGAQQIDPAQPLQELGLDSLLSIELRNSLGASLERTLPATLSLQLSNSQTLVRIYFARTRFESQEASAEAKSGFSPTSLVDEIEACRMKKSIVVDARAAGGTR